MLTTDKLPLIRSTIRRLAILCEATVELWRGDDGVAGRQSGWQRLAEEVRGGGGPLASGLTPPLDDAILSAALSLQTITVQEPYPVLALPLIAHHRLQGVLLLRAHQSAAPITAWRAPLEAFAPILGLFLHALDLDETFTSAVSLTRLMSIASQARLNDQLDREMARARRGRQAFALLMVGLDRHDELALELGPTRCDRVMQTLALLLRDGCRDGDVVGGHGPDRFLVLLPDSNGQGAQITANRHLDQIYRRPIALTGHTPFFLDVSIGIALFPVDGLTGGELIESAAGALRAARGLGGKRAIAA